MEPEKLKTMLGELGKAGEEAVPDELAARIKRRIPAELHPRRAGDSVSIIIDLRVSRLAAAAVIVLATVLLALFFGGRDGGDLYQDGKVLVGYIWGADQLGPGKLPSSWSGVDGQTGADSDTFYYGQKRLQDANDLLFHKRLSDGSYRVIFSDMRSQTVAAEELIKLQAQMIRKTTKN